MALRLTFDKVPVEVDPLKDQSSDYLNNVIDPHTDFRPRSNPNQDNRPKYSDIESKISILSDKDLQRFFGSSGYFPHR